MTNTQATMAVKFLVAPSWTPSIEDDPIAANPIDYNAPLTGERALNSER